MYSGISWCGAWIFDYLWGLLFYRSDLETDGEGILHLVKSSIRKRGNQCEKCIWTEACRLRIEPVHRTDARELDRGGGVSVKWNLSEYQGFWRSCRDAEKGDKGDIPAQCRRGVGVQGGVFWGACAFPFHRRAAHSYQAGARITWH